MKKGNIPVEQIADDGNVVIDYDYSLSVAEIKDRLEQYFPALRKWSESSNFFVGEYKGKKYAIRCKNVTYLGTPHPIYKKRIQISNDLQEFYKFAKEIKAKPILLGIYEHDGNIVFVHFKIDTYIEKKAHNSSAHIYTEDIAIAVTEGYFQKTDYFGNTITAFKAENVSVFLEEYLQTNNRESIYYQNVAQYYGEKEIPGKIDDASDKSVFVTKNNETCAFDVQSIKKDDLLERAYVYKNYLYEKVIPKFQKFFKNERKEWNGIDCYKEMIKDNYKNKFQPEWPGFYLEYEFEKYIKKNKIDGVVQYYQDKSSGGIDLDLYFPGLDAYGDLKSHSTNSRGIPGNDWNTVMSIINKDEPKGHIYYIICVNETVKDSEMGYEVTHFWNEQQNKKNLMSYSQKMKHHVSLKKMYILDINKSNKQFLTIFKQGINSNGKPRAPKIMIDEKNLEHFIVDEMEL